MSLTVSPFQATGVLVPPAGYLRAVRRICDDHGALLILDEVMCGMGRTGTNYYHAWQAEGADAPPDIQTVAKGVSGGYAPVAMVLASQAVVDGINHASGIWNHGHTFTSHPVSCAAALAVQTVIKRENLVRHAAEMGSLLGAQLRGALGHHPHVGDIRGRGLLWAIEFVADRTTKRPFEPEDGIAARIHAVGMSDPWNIFLYPGTGTADGFKGDHILIAPAYIITTEEVGYIVRQTTGVVCQVLGSIPLL